MAHPAYRSPLATLASLFDPITARLGRNLSSGEPRRREALVVLALVVTASLFSVLEPIAGASATTSTPVALDPYVGQGAPQTDEPEPSDSVEPSESPSDTPAPKATATKKPVAAKKPVAKKVVVHSFVALGDSLTAWPADDPWPSRLDAADPALRLIKNAGVPGNTTAQMRARVNSDVFTYKPDVLFVLGGTNDLGFGVSGSATISNLRAIIVAAKARKITVILLLIPPQSYRGSAPKIDSLNAAIVNLANAQRVVYVDIHTPLSTSAGLIYPKYTSDGLHFTGLGAQVVANTIRARIKGRGL